MTVACNLTAISPAQRARYSELAQKLRSAIQNRRELSNGYSYELGAEAITLLETAEWITMERLCCPFLTFQLEVGGASFRLTISGPDPSKAILLHAFPMDDR
jgi:hypothetical protein